jgi:hypothetical protein
MVVSPYGVSKINYGTDLYYYDINSLYPYAMLNKMPCSYLYFIDKITGKFDTP